MAGVRVFVRSLWLLLSLGANFSEAIGNYAVASYADETRPPYTAAPPAMDWECPGHERYGPALQNITNCISVCMPAVRIDT